jgi:uncharacterized membrane protein
MSLGPLEYLVVEFEGDHFTGEILPELHSLHDQGIVRVVDLVLVQKDAEGSITVRELSDLSEEALWSDGGRHSQFVVARRHR